MTYFINKKSNSLFNAENLFVLIIIIVFIIIEIPYLNRPLYWDEAWSYGPGVHAMYKNGPSLLPASISAWLSRGHPLFFYFISSLWMKIFGTSLTSIHILFLLISILLLLFVNKTTVFMANRRAGLFAVVLLIVLPLFLSQATFLLPEMLIALLSTMFIYFYLRKKIFLEIFIGSLLVLTKETGIIIVSSLVFYHFISNLSQIKSYKEIKQIFSSTLLHSVPIFVAIGFFTIQRISRGWFFYPEHIGMLTFNLTDFSNKITYIFKYVFLNEGRFILSLSFILGLFCIVCKNVVNKLELNYFKLGFIIIIFYSIFSAFNFLTVRYTLALFPIFAIFVSLVLNKLFEEKSYLAIIILLIFSISSIISSITSKEIGDNHLSFLNMVSANKKIINYCEKQNLYNDTIHPTFLMRYYLSDPFLGYLSSDKKFFISDDFNKAKYIIISSNEDYPNKNMVSDTNKFKLIKRVEVNNKSWCEIYRRK